MSYRFLSAFSTLLLLVGCLCIAAGIFVALRVLSVEEQAGRAILSLLALSVASLPCFAAAAASKLLLRVVWNQSLVLERLEQAGAARPNDRFA